MNLWRLLAVMRKEFLHVRRDPQTVILVLVMPLLTLILLGYTILSDITDIPFAIADLSHSVESRDFVAAFGTSDLFDIRHVIGGEDEIVSLIEEGAIRVGMILPPDYAESLARGEKAQVAIFLDGSNPIVAITALNAVQATVFSESAAIAQRTLGGGGRASAGGIDMRSRVWYNPDLRRANFLIPALVGLVMMTFMTQLVAGAIVRERAMGTMEQLITTPLRSLELIVGKVTPYTVLALVVALEVFVAGLIWFDVPMHGSFGLLLLYCLFFLAATLGWAMLISAIAHTEREARTLSLLIMLPSMFLSGMFFSRTMMPPVLQFIGNLVPLTHFLVMIRAVVLKGIGIELVMPEVFGLVAFGLVTMALAAMRFRTKLG